MPSFGVAIAVAAAGLASGLLLAVAIQKVGPAGAIVPAVAVGGLILLRFPGAALALLLVSVVLIEPETPGLLPSFSPFYEVVGLSLTPIDLLLFVGLGGLLLRFAIEGQRPKLPDPLTAPLVLLGLTTVAGVVTGYTAHAGVSNGELYHRAMNDVYLILLPVLVVNVLRDTQALRTFAAVAVGLAAYKGLSGSYAALSGLGADLTESAVSYLDPLPNLLMLTFLLGTVAALVRRVKLPTWMLASVPLTLLALLLSYRRSFWIAAVFCLIVVAIIASRRRGRAVIAVGGVALALTFVTVLAVGASGPAAKPLVTRAQQLSPAGIEADRGDRYRADERRNVIANLHEHPLTGIGLGVSWKVHYPLAEAHNRAYAHVALLWFWLAFGPLGPLAYLVLLGAGLLTAIAVWRRHPDPIVQVGAIACFGAILALFIVELTATFTGIEPRLSLILGAGLGWLAAAWRDLPEPDPAPVLRVGAAKAKGA
jgi:hypothetical protein